MAFIKRHPDNIDRLILVELKKYPPSTMRYIAKIAGRSHVAIKQRYSWLEEQGYIRLAENAAKKSARSMILTTLGFEYLSNGGAI
jgi:SOS-response transcriptional repressor LexA